MVAEENPGMWFTVSSMFGRAKNNCHVRPRATRRARAQASAAGGLGPPRWPGRHRDAP